MKNNERVKGVKNQFPNKFVLAWIEAKNSIEYIAILKLYSLLASKKMNNELITAKIAGKY